MSNPKRMRLLTDFERVVALNQRSNLIQIKPLDEDMTRYKVTYRCKGLYKDYVNEEIKENEFHVMEIYLHKDYPRRPPQLLWKGSIFHPNILSISNNGGVCIGAWSPSETLDNLIIRIGEMVQYKIYKIDDFLNEDASIWAKAHLDRFPIDSRPLVKD